MFLEAFMISLMRGTPSVMFMDATPAKWKVFRVIWVPGSPMLWAHRAPTAEPGSIWALQESTNKRRRLSGGVRAESFWFHCCSSVGKTTQHISEQTGTLKDVGLFPLSLKSFCTSCTCPCRFQETSPAALGWYDPADRELLAAGGKTCDVIRQSWIQLSTRGPWDRTSLVPLSLIPYLSLVLLILSAMLLTNFLISCKSYHYVLVNPSIE